MKTYEVSTRYGNYNVFISVKKYWSNGNLAIELFCPYVGPFAKLTVNLGILPENQAYVDTNNCPWAPEFIEENGFGKPTGEMGASGWCQYPLYEFDLEKLKGGA